MSDPYISSTRAKICGITQLEQALEIAQCGAHYLGINFWSHSKRYLPWEQAKTWLPQLPESCKTIGVFVNPDFDELMSMADSGLIHAFQLHGDESSAFCNEMQRRGLKIIKAFQVQSEATLQLIDAYQTDDILLDAYHPQERGGLGHTFPWQLAQQFQAKFPQKRLWLAGGLISSNVTEAIQGTHPFAVDVASGVESGIPGVKDLEKVQSFLHAVASAQITA